MTSCCLCVNQTTLTPPAAQGYLRKVVPATSLGSSGVRFPESDPRWSFPGVTDRPPRRGQSERFNQSFTGILLNMDELKKLDETHTLHIQTHTRSDSEIPYLNIKACDWLEMIH